MWTRAGSDPSSRSFTIDQFGGMMGHATPENHTRGYAVRQRPSLLQIFCGDYKCAHSVVINADRWGDDVRLSDLEPKFTCTVCGHRGADIGPLFEHARMGAG
jgi:hypothetical protein